MQISRNHPKTLFLSNGPYVEISGNLKVRSEYKWCDVCAYDASFTECTTSGSQLHNQLSSVALLSPECRGSRYSKNCFIVMDNDEE